MMTRTLSWVEAVEGGTPRISLKAFAIVAAYDEEMSTGLSEDMELVLDINSPLFLRMMPFHV